MAYRLLYTDESLTGLEVIPDGIRADNPTAAERFAVSLFDHLDLLEPFPQLGSTVARRARIRKLLHSPVRVYYSIDRQRQLIVMLHFWHTSRRAPKFD